MYAGLFRGQVTGLAHKGVLDEPQFTRHDFELLLVTPTTMVMETGVQTRAIDLDRNQGSANAAVRMFH